MKWIINPFFAYPYNEVTAIPINVKVEMPDSVPIPQRLVERVISMASDIFILDECICRGVTNCSSYSKKIGCMALGRPVKRMHPSHGRLVSREEALAHAKKAADAGLIANIAHVWIDPLAFALPNFNRLMFICFCDDCCCLYRTYLKDRGPNLDKAYKRLPGISVRVERELCEKCGKCAELCFVGAIRMEAGRPVITEDCRGCGRCVEMCPHQAMKLELEDEETLFARLKERIEAVADIS